MRTYALFFIAMLATACGNGSTNGSLDNRKTDQDDVSPMIPLPEGCHPQPGEPWLVVQGPFIEEFKAFRTFLEGPDTITKVIQPEQITTNRTLTFAGTLRCDLWGWVDVFSTSYDEGDDSIYKNRDCFPSHSIEVDTEGKFRETLTLGQYGGYLFFDAAQCRPPSSRAPIQYQTWIDIKIDYIPPKVTFTSFLGLNYFARRTCSETSGCIYQGITFTGSLGVWGIATIQDEGRASQDAYPLIASEVHTPDDCPLGNRQLYNVWGADGLFPNPFKAMLGSTGDGTKLVGIQVFDLVNRPSPCITTPIPFNTTIPAANLFAPKPYTNLCSQGVEISFNLEIEITGVRSGTSVPITINGMGDQFEKKTLVETTRGPGIHAIPIQFMLPTHPSDTDRVSLEVITDQNSTMVAEFYCKPPHTP